MSRARDFADLAGSADAGGITGKNLLGNGAMQVAQRSTSQTGLGASDGYFTLDRFKVDHGATSAGRYTMSQSAVTDLAGFPNALKIDCTTADTSIAAGEALILNQKIEGLACQSLKASSTSTNAFTLSFYAKSNASRAIASEILLTEGTNRQISKLHTIGTSWARYTMTVPAASSTEIDNDNTDAMQVQFWLHGGSTYTGGTLNNASLASLTNANRAAGIGSIFASTDNSIEITGVQLEVGAATPFEHRSFGDELARCQRYFERFKRSYSEMGQSSSADATLWAGCSRSGNSGNNQGVMRYTRKRNNPTLSVSSATHINSIFPISPFNTSLSGFALSGNAGIDSAFINATNNASSAPGSDCASFVYIPNDSGYLDVDAEL